MAREFGEYEILGKIAEGGMGAVYRARQAALDRVVALKIIRSLATAAPRVRERFLGEARLAARLHHPNIVTIHEVGTENGVPYYTMDFVEGRSLKGLLARGRLPEGQVVALLQKVARAVGHAHSQNIIHRDLKPGNILIDANGEPYVTDFGLACDLTAAERVTKTGQMLGTAPYMSPEQANGKAKELDARSDVWSLGAILYEALTGRLPFVGNSKFSILLRIIEEPVTPIEKLVPGISPMLAAICHRALAKRPSDRFPNADAMAGELEAYLAGGEISEATTRAGQHLIERPAKSLRAPVIAGAAVLLVALLAIVLRPGMPRPGAPPRSGTTPKPAPARRHTATPSPSPEPLPKDSAPAARADAPELERARQLMRQSRYDEALAALDPLVRQRVRPAQDLATTARNLEGLRAAALVAIRGAGFAGIDVSFPDTGDRRLSLTADGRLRFVAPSGLVNTRDWADLSPTEAATLFRAVLAPLTPQHRAAIEAFERFHGLTR